MTIIIAALVFILGTAIGSFLSVTIYRLHENEKGIISGRSFCPACKKPLKWRHLVPIFSFLFLRGKCAYCDKKISPHYFILELLTGLAFLAAFFYWNFVVTIPSTVNPSIFNYEINWQIFEVFVFYLIEFSLLVGIFFYDLMYKEIPDRFSLTAIVIAIAGGLLLKTISPLNMLIGGVSIFAFFALQFLLSKGKWIGGGDIRLGALIGVLLGWQLGLVALIIAYILGSIYSVILLIQKKITGKSAIPFGPFLVTGTFVAIFFGAQILYWYLNSFVIL